MDEDDLIRAQRGILGDIHPNRAARDRVDDGASDSGVWDTSGASMAGDSPGTRGQHAGRVEITDGVERPPR